MKQRIGVDVDGVLANFNSAFIDRVIGITGRDLFPSRPFDIPCWDYPQHYGYTDAEITAVWQGIEADPQFWERLPTYSTTYDDLDYLLDRHQHGDDVYFITSRVGPTAKAQTETWLRATCEFFWHPTVLISAQKGLCALALQLTVYIDDRLENVLDVHHNSHAKTFVMDRPWNRYLDHPGIARTSTVMGIVESPLVPTDALTPR